MSLPFRQSLEGAICGRGDEHLARQPKCRSYVDQCITRKHHLPPIPHHTPHSTPGLKARRTLLGVQLQRRAVRLPALLTTEEALPATTLTIGAGTPPGYVFI